MFPIFCGFCIPEGYDMPPIGAHIDQWQGTGWRSMLAVTIWRGDAYCTKHWNQYRETGTVTSGRLTTETP